LCFGLCFETTKFTLIFLFISRSLQCCHASHSLTGFFPDTGVTPTTPIHTAISLVGIGLGFGFTLYTQRSVIILHVCIYVAYIGTSKTVNYVNKTV